MIDDLVMTARGRDAYIIGPQPEKVRIEGITTQAMVAIHDPVSKTTAVGYFSNLRQSEEFGSMLDMVRVSWSLDRLVVTLVGSLFGNTRIGPGNDLQLMDRFYPLAALKDIGIPNSRIKERHLSYKAPGAVNLIFNMRTGRAQIRRQPVARQDFELPDPPEPDQGEMYDPPEVDKMRAYDFPEVNEERF